MKYFRGTDEKFIIPMRSVPETCKSNPVKWLFIGACKSYQTNYECKAPDGRFYGCLSYVMAGSDVDLSKDHYSDVLARWSESLERIVRYPQEIDAEGNPCGVSARERSSAATEHVEEHSTEGNKSDTIL